MADVYAVADLVITRAGMGTLTELAALGMPSVIVPIPNSHQEENAKYFFEAGSAKVFDERHSASELAQDVNKLLANADELNYLSLNMRQINDSEAAKKVVELLYIK